MTYMRKRLLAALLCLPLSACFYAKADGEAVRTDLDALKVDLAAQRTEREKSDKQMAARLSEMQTVLCLSPTDHWPAPLSLATTRGISVDVFSSRY